MPIGPKLRFEVFKRDDFTCRYCGRKTPAVVLEVDHVIPVAEGGGDEIENLVTSCWECNSGKGKRLLDVMNAEGDVHEKAAALLEREMQLREYNEVRQKIRERENADIQRVLEAWAQHWPGGQPDYWPNEPQIRSLLNEISVVDLVDAVAIASDKITPTFARVKYFFGVAYTRARGPKVAPQAPAEKKTKKRTNEPLEWAGFAIAVAGPNSLRSFQEQANQWTFSDDGRPESKEHLFRSFTKTDWHHFTAGLLRGCGKWVESGQGDVTPGDLWNFVRDVGWSIGFGGIDGGFCPAPTGDLAMRVRDAIDHAYRRGTNVLSHTTWPAEIWEVFTSEIVRGVRAFAEWRAGDHGWSWTEEEDLAHVLGAVIGQLGPEVALRALWSLSEPSDFDRVSAVTTWMGPSWSAQRAAAFSGGLYEGLDWYRKRHAGVEGEKDAEPHHQRVDNNIA